jgi:hypothetical protein
LSLGKISSSLHDENPSGFIPMENLNGNWEGMECSSTSSKKKPSAFAAEG